MRRGKATTQSKPVVLAFGKLADIVAMPADPTDDVSVTARADFVTKGARVYRGPESAAGAAIGA